MRNSIILKNYLNIFEEKVAIGVITPGMLIEITSVDKVQAHSVSGGNALIMFALEDELQGKTINENYAVADQVQLWIPQRGDQVFAILQDGENVAIGDLVESNGDGTLIKYVADTHSSAEVGTVIPNQIIGQVLEAVDLSDSSGAESSGPLAYEKRVKIRVM